MPYRPPVPERGRGILTRLAGPALILWTVQLIVREFAFAFSHGSSPGDTSGTFLSLTALDYARFWTAFALLAIVGVAGLYAMVEPRIHSLGKAGLIFAMVGLALFFVSSVMQFSILDPNTYFHSTLVMGGWLLSIVAYLVTAAGLLLAGQDIARTRALARGRYLVLAIGLLAVPTLVAQSWVVGQSLDTSAWRLIFGSVSLPSDLCWLWLGVTLLGAAAVGDSAAETTLRTTT